MVCGGGKIGSTLFRGGFGVEVLVGVSGVQVGSQVGVIVADRVGVAEGVFVGLGVSVVVLVIVLVEDGDEVQVGVSEETVRKSGESVSRGVSVLSEESKVALVSLLTFCFSSFPFR